MYQKILRFARQLLILRIGYFIRSLKCLQISVKCNIIIVGVLLGVKRNAKHLVAIREAVLQFATVDPDVVELRFEVVIWIAVCFITYPFSTSR